MKTVHVKFPSQGKVEVHKDYFIEECDILSTQYCSSEQFEKLLQPESRKQVIEIYCKDDLSRPPVYIDGSKYQTPLAGVLASEIKECA